MLVWNTEMNLYVLHFMNALGAGLVCGTKINILDHDGTFVCSSYSWASAPDTTQKPHGFLKGQISP